jgi:hypothetical protein
MDIVKEAAALQRMTPLQLRAKYAEVFGEATRSGHKEFLVRKIAWRLQAQTEGDLSERARRRAMELANDLDIRTRAPATPVAIPASAFTATGTVPSGGDTRLPMIGTVINRDYKGRTIRVTVLRDGFEFEGQTYRSLSAIAKAVTGTHWNGFHFFGLAKTGRNA